ncbi:hypothetical protein [Streptomyces sp. UNOB3_S3]|uniref:hypothetical protein n=1 Tax=Streptomyces sp. UNOB3_S3 TaxID=2871682 RepID=UPI001E2F62C5|nr:hypothetical protein [Streptomyces sp. UNOB3_S3]MCC3779658.1 hypothetical protein [Streptomyces sp. UNOB3_S3]
MACTTGIWFGCPPFVAASIQDRETRQSYNELEDLFSDLQRVAAANAHWPRPKDRSWSADDSTEHRGGKFSEHTPYMIKQQAQESSPNGKADMFYTLVSMLATPEEVPGNYGTSSPRRRPSLADLLMRSPLQQALLALLSGRGRPGVTPGPLSIAA